MAKQDSAGFLSQIQDSGAQDVMLEMLRLMMQTVLEEGMTRHVGAQCHERTPERRGHRNGYKPRTVKTRMGELALSVPQARGIEPYEPFPLAKWQRSERALLVACAEMYFMGASNTSSGWTRTALGAISALTRRMKVSTTSRSSVIGSSPVNLVRRLLTGKGDKCASPKPREQKLTFADQAEAQ